MEWPNPVVSANGKVVAARWDKDVLVLHLAEDIVGPCSTDVRSLENVGFETENGSICSK